MLLRKGMPNTSTLVDPCKLLLTTPGINARNGEYDTFGVPATILAQLPARKWCGARKMRPQLHPVPADPRRRYGEVAAATGALLVRFEKLLEADAPLAEVLPSIYKQHEARYAGYTLRQLCQEMGTIRMRVTT